MRVSDYDYSIRMSATSALTSHYLSKNDWNNILRLMTAKDSSVRRGVDIELGEPYWMDKMFEDPFSSLKLIKNSTRTIMNLYKEGKISVQAKKGNYFLYKHRTRAFVIEQR